MLYIQVIIQYKHYDIFVILTGKQFSINTTFVLYLQVINTLLTP